MGLYKKINHPLPPRGKEASMARQHMNAPERRVEIDRKKLVNTLKTNRELHEQAYNEAIEGYYNQLVTAVLRTKENIDTFGAELNTDNVMKMGEKAHKILDPITGLRRPRNYLQAYDEAIAIFEWDVRDTVELTVDEVLKFCENRWEWRDNFVGMAASYGSQTARSL